MRRASIIDVTVVGGAAVVAAWAYGALSGRSGEQLAAIFLVNLIAVVGLQMISGNSGVLSFGHMAFAGIGAYATAVLITPVALKDAIVPAAPFGLSTGSLPQAAGIAVGVVLATAVGSVLAVLAARVSGMVAAIVSLAALMGTHSVLVNWTSLTGGPEGFFGIPGIGLSWLGLLALGAVAVARVLRGLAAGRRLQALREDPVAAQAVGVAPRAPLVVGWILSLGIVALAGALRAQVVGTVTPDDFSFGLTFLVLAMLILGGMGSVTGAIVGAVAVTALTEVARVIGDGVSVAGVTTPRIAGLPDLVLGIVLVTAMIARPAGLLDRWELSDLISRRRAEKKQPARHPSAESTSTPRQTPSRRLVVERARVAFGPITAVDDASLELGTGEIVGVIGPNGAGKTTLLNALSGVTRLEGGRVLLDGNDVTRLTAHELARLGIARTFQNIRLFAGLTVAENVQATQAACRGRDTSRLARGQLFAEVGLGGSVERLARELPAGDQRRLELARALAAQPSFLLLDEPAAGMNTEETADLADRLAEINRRRGCALLVIDHDLRFIATLCHRIYVMAEGRILAQGSPADVLRDSAVIESYVGRRHQARLNGRRATAPVRPTPNVGGVHEDPAAAS